jgi:protein-arginine deiminase
VKIVAGTGAGQAKEIAASASNTLTIGGSWSPTPDASSRYVVVQKSKMWSSIGPAMTTVQNTIMEHKTYNQNKQINQLNVIRSALTNEIADITFISIPSVFWEHQEGGSWSYTPNMVNLLVDGTSLITANPFGPRNEAGEDLLLEDVINRVSGHTVHPLDNWDWYHRMQGGVHCGTNVKRIPPTNLKWWNGSN